MRLKFCVSERRRNTLRQNGGKEKEIKRLDCGTAQDPSRNMEVLSNSSVLVWPKGLLIYRCVSDSNSGIMVVKVH